MVDTAPDETNRHPSALAYRFRTGTHVGYPLCLFLLSHRPVYLGHCLYQLHESDHRTVGQTGKGSGHAQSRGRPTRPTYPAVRSEEHTSELQSLMRISYAVFCLKKKT